MLQAKFSRNLGYTLLLSCVQSVFCAVRKDCLSFASLSFTFTWMDHFVHEPSMTWHGIFFWQSFWICCWLFYVIGGVAWDFLLKTSKNSRVMWRLVMRVTKLFPMFCRLSTHSFLYSGLNYPLLNLFHHAVTNSSSSCIYSYSCLQHWLQPLYTTHHLHDCTLLPISSLSF